MFPKTTGNEASYYQNFKAARRQSPTATNFYFSRNPHNNPNNNPSIFGNYSLLPSLAAGG